MNYSGLTEHELAMYALSLQITYLAEYMAQMDVIWSFGFLPTYIDENCLRVLFTPFGNLLGVSVDR